MVKINIRNITLTLVLLSIGKLVIFDIGPKITLIMQQKIVKDQFKEFFDGEKVLNTDKTGYNIWQIGLDDNNIVNIYMTASGPIVKAKTINFKVDWDYTSSQDYNRRNGHEAFLKFIEEKNK